jgi:hypothetical protein
VWEPQAEPEPEGEAACLSDTAGRCQSRPAAPLGVPRSTKTHSTLLSGSSEWQVLLVARHPMSHNMMRITSLIGLKLKRRAPRRLLCDWRLPVPLTVLYTDFTVTSYYSWPLLLGHGAAWGHPTQAATGSGSASS